MLHLNDEMRKAGGDKPDAAFIRSQKVKSIPHLITPTTATLPFFLMSKGNRPLEVVKLATGNKPNRCAKATLGCSTRLLCRPSLAQEFASKSERVNGVCVREYTARMGQKNSMAIGRYDQNGQTNADVCLCAQAEGGLESGGLFDFLSHPPKFNTKSKPMITNKEMQDILANEKITQFGGAITYTAPSKEDIKKSILAFIEITRALSDAIRDLKQVPSGHLYANVMSMMTLDTFEMVISTLVEAKLVKHYPSHLLEWVGPVSESK